MKVATIIAIANMLDKAVEEKKAIKGSIWARRSADMDAPGARTWRSEYSKAAEDYNTIADVRDDFLNHDWH